MLVSGTLVYSRGDEVQSKKEHLEYEAQAAEEGEAQPSVLTPGQSHACKNEMTQKQKGVNKN